MFCNPICPAAADADGPDSNCGANYSLGAFAAITKTRIDLLFSSSPSFVDLHSSVAVRRSAHLLLSFISSPTIARFLLLPVHRSHVPDIEADANFEDASKALILTHKEVMADAVPY
ncbi:hypothetical protein L2E82_44573 [Cichorium intybus]|uniref:Uncharacterized protein n=1 Tax=Cichorium intybus TaxID=13427 RepID=A0ACB8ZRX3_CICIN|nr:hypothetical protein L2E82_44573 [Cichorium intybus]